MPSYASERQGKNIYSFTDIVRLEEQEKEFKFLLNSMPIYIEIDGDFNIFRKLYEEEIPPTFSEIMGSTNTAVVVPDNMGRELKEAYKTIVNNIMLYPYDIITTFDIDQLMHYNTLIIVGQPDNKLIDSIFYDDTGLIRWDKEKEVYILSNRHITGRDEFVVIASKNKKDQSKRVLIVYGNSLNSIRTATKALPHYRKYGYLLFDNGKNILKGIWDVKTSPLVFKVTQ